MLLNFSSVYLTVSFLFIWKYQGILNYIYLAFFLYISLMYCSGLKLQMYSPCVVVTEWGGDDSTSKNHFLVCAASVCFDLEPSEYPVEDSSGEIQEVGIERERKMCPQ